MTAGAALRTKRTTLGFLPSDLANLAVWLDTGSLQALAEGASITTWPDTSGNGRDATQASPTVKPTYRTNVLNGRAVARFDGGDHISTAAFGVEIAQPTTIAVVLKASSVAGTPRVVSSATTNKDHTIFGSSGNLALFAGTTLASATALDTTAQVLLGVFNGVSSVLRRNGTQIATGAAGAQNLASIRLGASPSGSGNLTGDIAEVIVYAADRSANAAAIERYLGIKYGISVA